MSLTVFFRKLIGWVRFNSFERDYYFYFSMCWKFLAFIFYCKFHFTENILKWRVGRIRPTRHGMCKKKKKGEIAILKISGIIRHLFREEVNNVFSWNIDISFSVVNHLKFIHLFNN